MEDGGRTQARAILINVSLSAKLLRMFPCVLLVNTRKPDVDMHKHANTEIMVETCVTLANRSIVGVRREP